MPDAFARRDRGRQAYQAHRLATRRSVRIALALGQGLKRGPRAARELLNAGAGELDLPGPDIHERHWYGSLRVAHLSERPITGGLIPGTRLRPDRWRTQLRRDRPDLILLDALWEDTSEFDALVARRDHRFVVDRSVIARPTSRKAVLTINGVGDDPIVDERDFNPIDAPYRPSGSITTLSDHATAAEVLTQDARADVLVSSGAAEQVGRDLRLQAAGAVVVAREPSPTWLTRCGEATSGKHPEVLLSADAWERASVTSRRRSLLDYGRHRTIERLLDTLALSLTPPRISVLLCTRRPHHLASALAQIAAQHYPKLEIVLGLHGVPRPSDGVLRAAGSRPVRIVEVDAGRPLGAVLNAALDESTGALVAKMDDDDFYGPDHLGDLVLALRYSGATIVGRRCTTTYLERRDRTVVPGPEHQERWTTHLPGATMLMHADAIRRLRWRDVPNAVDTELVRSVTSEGGSIYSTHRFGFVRRRHDDHTYARSDRSFGGGNGVAGLDRTSLDIPGGTAG